jgi:hypothetical protein
MTETTTKQELGPNQKKWLEALRSGKYEQGTQYLRTIDDKFCCLGVACDLAGIPASRDAINLADQNYYLYDSYSQILPEFAQAYLSAQGSSGDAHPDGFACSLSQLNDTGKSFMEIADIVERDPAVYFKEPR